MAICLVIGHVLPSSETCRTFKRGMLYELYIQERHPLHFSASLPYMHQAHPSQHCALSSSSSGSGSGSGSGSSSKSSNSSSNSNNSNINSNINSISTRPAPTITSTNTTTSISRQTFKTYPSARRATTVAQGHGQGEGQRCSPSSRFFLSTYWVWWGYKAMHRCSFGQFGQP